ncbi:MAG TPA: FAD-binding oxidoreductase [Thermoleophilaceae bacterium]|nr:FAD-binding oxidoreductase [Thermoleophilaceae bacterium]
MNTSSAPSHDVIRVLRNAVQGRVIEPGDGDYDPARAIFYGGMDRRPAAIARVAGADDVARVVKIARDSGVELAVRGGGHSSAGHGVCEGGIVLDLRDMRSLAIDVERRVAWAETGLTTGEYTAAAGTSRLATGFGDAPSVGIGGITLGGGVGFLARKHGLTVDDLLAAEIVTADARILRVDAEHHSDLFWAIRGGGGNFGVATRLRFRLHELPAIYGGTLILPVTPDVIEGFVAAADDAPDELTTIANVMRAPPLPFLPEELHGRLLVMGMFAFAGPPSDGERAVAPFRALAEPIVDGLRPMTYAELFPAEEADFHPIFKARTSYVDSFDRAAAEAIVEHLTAAPAPIAVTQLRVLGGAVARVEADATAYAHRDRRMMVNVAAGTLDPAAVDGLGEWVDGLAGQLADGRSGAYVNFLSDEGPERVREAYPGSTWDRLADIKARYDPTNLFRLNHNVPPADRPEEAAAG